MEGRCRPEAGRRPRRGGATAKRACSGELRGGDQQQPYGTRTRDRGAVKRRRLRIMPPSYGRNTPRAWKPRNSGRGALRCRSWPRTDGDRALAHAAFDIARPFVPMSVHVVPSRLRARRHRAGADRRDSALRGRHSLSLTSAFGAYVACHDSHDPFPSAAPTPCGVPLREVVFRCAIRAEPRDPAVRTRVAELLERAGLDPAHYARYPHEFSAERAGPHPGVHRSRSGRRTSGRRSSGGDAARPCGGVRARRSGLRGAAGPVRQAAPHLRSRSRPGPRRAAPCGTPGAGRDVITDSAARPPVRGRAVGPGTSARRTRL